MWVGGCLTWIPACAGKTGSEGWLVCYLGDWWRTWIPACAGKTGSEGWLVCYLGDWVANLDTGLRRHDRFRGVAGVGVGDWIPVFAGMTGLEAWLGLGSVIGYRSSPV